MCFGGAPAVPAPPQPPQAAQSPDPAAVRAGTAARAPAQFNGTLLTGPAGAAVASGQLGGKRLLGE